MRKESSLWSRQRDFSIADALGDATLSDVKTLVTRVNDARARITRLNNLVDMIYKLKMKQQG